MASVTIRNLDDDLKALLRVRAAEHGTSMEEEVRDMLRTALATERAAPLRLGRAIRKRMAQLGGIDLPEPDREPMRQPPEF